MNKLNHRYIYIYNGNTYIFKKALIRGLQSFCVVRWHDSKFAGWKYFLIAEEEKKAVILWNLWKLSA